MTVSTQYAVFVSEDVGHENDGQCERESARVMREKGEAKQHWAGETDVGGNCAVDDSMMRTHGLHLGLDTSFVHIQCEFQVRYRCMRLRVLGG